MKISTSGITGSHDNYDKLLKELPEASQSNYTYFRKRFVKPFTHIIYPLYPVCSEDGLEFLTLLPSPRCQDCRPTPLHPAPQLCYDPRKLRIWTTIHAFHIGLILWRKVCLSFIILEALDFFMWSGHSSLSEIIYKGFSPSVGLFII